MANLSFNLHMQEDTAVTHRKFSDFYTLDMDESAIFIHNEAEVDRLLKSLRAIKRAIQKEVGK